ncbi:MAG: MATE family efflux transporter [Gammaproteobacteria bacterium]|nr:MATE family efflux transporter [Gammaproteobacteria bacterium]
MKQIHKDIFAIALPVSAGMLSQNLMSLVDTYMVGPLGKHALAALGLGAFIFYLCFAVTIGFSTAVQSETVKRSPDMDTGPLFSALLFLVVTMPFATLFLYFAMPWLLTFYDGDAHVVDETTNYLQMRFLGIAFVAMSFSFRGYWTALGQARIFLITVLVMHACNIALNYVFIHGNFGMPAMGVSGAGFASAISAFIGCMVYVVFLFARLPRPLKRSPLAIKPLLTIAIPYGMQQLSVGMGMVVLFAMIGLIGTAQLAAATVVTNISLFVVMPGIGIGIAAVTISGREIRQNRFDNVAANMNQVVKLAVVLFMLAGLPMWLMPEMLLGMFIDDAETLSLAVIPLVITGLALAIDAIVLICNQSLFIVGQGKKWVFTIIALQWLVLFPSVYYFCVLLGYPFYLVWVIKVLISVIQAFIASALWRKGIVQLEAQAV